MGKKINQLDAASDAEAVDSTRLFANANSTTGVAKKMTIAQAKLAFSSFKKKYVATGAEGTVLTISELLNKEVLDISREGQILYEVTSSPDSTEFTFNPATNTITLGLAVNNAGERFLIKYKTP